MSYIGSRGCVLCQFIEPVTFARCVFIFALRNIALGRYLVEHIRHDVRPEKDIAKLRAIERTRKLASPAIKNTLR